MRRGSTRRRGGWRTARGFDASAVATGEARDDLAAHACGAIAALIGSAAYVYGVKYHTIYAAEQMVKTRHLIAKEKDAINLLRAEYAHLARPDRIQELADAKLGMQPLALYQIATVAELPDAQPKVEFDRPHAGVARASTRTTKPPPPKLAAPPRR